MKPNETIQIEDELAAIREEHEAREAARAAELARMRRIEDERERADDERKETFAAMRRSLAQDIGVNGGAAREALSMRQSSAPGQTRYILEPLLRLWHSPQHVSSARGPKADAAREARHASAAMGQLPPVRADDAAFGTEAQVRAAVPAFVVDDRTRGDLVTMAQVSSAYLALVDAFGLPAIRELPPAVESPQAARERLGPAPLTMGAVATGDLLGGGGKKSHYLDLVPNRDNLEVEKRIKVDDENDPVELRNRELKLIDERYEIARRTRREEYRAALIAQRVDIVAAIDRALGELPMGEAWFFTRHLRRTAAGERPVQLTPDHDLFDLPIEKVFHFACAAGARFNFTPSKPKKKN